MQQNERLKKKKILVTGGSGFLGSYVVEELKRRGVLEKDILIPSSKKFDLRKKSVCLKITENINIVIHLAGNVGGIEKNRKFPGTLFYDNAIMGIELMEAARKNNVEKFICLGTICSYPKYTSTPFQEENLWDGYPEETNAPYGLAKKMLLVQSQAYRQQYNFNSIYLLPVNLYGPGDNFNLESSHVIPALIRKIIEAKDLEKNSIEVWGDGTPTREFLYVADAARGIVQAAINYNNSFPINLGSGSEISIKNLVKLISEILKFNGIVVWNTSMPNGQPRRLLDVSKANKEFRFKARTPFKSGLKKTIKWFIQNRGKIHGQI